MNRKDEARDILSSLDMPLSQQSDICCYTLLALSNVSNDIGWDFAKNDWMRVFDIMHHTTEKFQIQYAPNSRETFRKQALHHFRNAVIIEDNGKATNSPNYMYRLTEEFQNLVRSYGSSEWEGLLDNFLTNQPTLAELYTSKKKMTKHPVKINGEDYELSTGKHNELQKRILEEFAPRFAPHSECLYLGDTAEKALYKNTELLHKLGFTITLHEKMPDVVLYNSKKDWLYFIEVVTSVGPIDAKRVIELESMTENVASGKIYITAFPDFKIFKSFSESLAWETEVWIASLPEHMIHMNGDKFLGPR
ncbi:MAG: restriction endonuclease [Oscillospiraceae bacterium]|nr:restriction endonuclease [Oscillospiraceae bacterium]